MLHQLDPGAPRHSALNSAAACSVPAVDEESGRPKALLKTGRGWLLAITAAVVGFVIAMVIYGAPWHRSAAWGDVPTWLLAGGAGVTAWLALLQLSDLRKQIAGEIKRNEKRDRLLAKQLAEAEVRGEFRASAAGRRRQPGIRRTDDRACGKQLTSPDQRRYVQDHVEDQSAQHGGSDRQRRTRTNPSWPEVLAGRQGCRPG